MYSSASKQTWKGVDRWTISMRCCFWGILVFTNYMARKKYLDMDVRCLIISLSYRTHVDRL